MQTREIPTLRSTDNAGNSVNLVSGIVRLPSGWDFSVQLETDDRFYFAYLYHGLNYSYVKFCLDVQRLNHLCLPIQIFEPSLLESLFAYKND